MPTTILAINKSVEDPHTGAAATHHLIEYYSVDVRSNMSTATVSGYVSAATKQAGLHPLVSTTASVQGTPPVGADPVQWLYTRLIDPPPAAMDASGNPILGQQPTVFFGAPTLNAQEEESAPK